MRIVSVDLQIALLSILGGGEGEGRVRLDDIQKSLLTPAIL